jgi:DDE superfamily endonuclease
LKEKLAVYRINHSDTYNMDEKGFMIGVLQASKRYFNRDEAKTSRLKGAGQDGNREFITIIASICQDGQALPPAIIYAAAPNNHQDSWYEELDTAEPIAHFITSSNGWTNDDIGYEWLTNVFDRHTKKKASHGRDYRLLFLDGHSSHINMRFIEFCDQNKILLMAYPPHSTHRLQPLDVSLFNPLANFYSQNLDNWLLRSYGTCSMSKRHFWGLFKPAFDAAFTAENVASGWRKTGLYPLDEEVILSQVRIPESRPTSSDASSLSAFSASSWKRANRHLQETYGPPVSRAERKIYNTVDYLSAENQLQRIEIGMLRERLDIQEKHGKRQQTLFSELRAETDNKALFFSPARVQTARDLLMKRDQDKLAEKERKQVEKDKKAQEKLQKEAALAEKREQRAIAKAERERLAAEKKQAKEEAKLQKLAELQLISQCNSIKKRKRNSLVQKPAYKPRKKRALAPERSAVPIPAPSRSRAIRKLPERYCI